MADDDGDVANEWPPEGHFVIGGAWGLQVSTECLGCTLTSRTASHDLEIGLPQRDTEPDPIPSEIRWRLGQPAIPNMELVPPKWACGPVDDREREEERRVSPVWGTTLGSDTGEVTYPESARDTALVIRCRFYTTVEASNEAEFEEATKRFLGELDDWWTRFTAWVGVVTGQDFLGLGGYMRQGTQSGDIRTWTCDGNGQRAGRGIRSSYPPSRPGIPVSKLQLEDLRGCVTATGKYPPPAEWALIRDARLLLNAGHIRRAVLDAGAAAELAMTTLIDQYLDAANAQEPVRLAFAKFNNLGRKRDLLKVLSPGLLPARVQPDLIEMRNTASHGGVEITFDQALTTVEIATEIVGAARPLASLLPPQTA